MSHSQQPGSRFETIFGFAALAAVVVGIGLLVLSAINGEPGDRAEEACMEWGGELSGVPGTDGRRDDQIKCSQGDVEVTFSDDGTRDEGDIKHARSYCEEQEAESVAAATDGADLISWDPESHRDTYAWNTETYECDERQVRLTRAQMKRLRYRYLMSQAKSYLMDEPRMALQYANRAIDIRSSAASRRMIRSASRAVDRAANAPSVPSYGTPTPSGGPSGSVGGSASGAARRVWGWIR